MRSLFPRPHRPSNRSLPPPGLGLRLLTPRLADLAPPPGRDIGLMIRVRLEGPAVADGLGPKPQRLEPLVVLAQRRGPSRVHHHTAEPPLLPKLLQQLAVVIQPKGRQPRQMIGLGTARDDAGGLRTFADDRMATGDSPNFRRPGCLSSSRATEILEEPMAVKLTNGPMMADLAASIWTRLPTYA